MSKPPKATRHHNSRKLSSLLPLRAIQNLTFSNETPCITTIPVSHTVAYGSLSRMITKKDQGGAVGFDSHYRSRPFRIPYKSNLCTNIIMIHSVAKKFPKLFHKMNISEKILIACPSGPSGPSGPTIHFSFFYVPKQYP